MKFKINNMTYQILEVNIEILNTKYIKEFPEEKGSLVFGHCSYVDHIIRINKDLNEEEKIRVLKHELAHCWMWNTSNACHDKYSEEHVADIVADSIDTIYEIVENYKRYIKNH